MIVKAAIKDADGNIWDVPQPGRHANVFFPNSVVRQGDKNIVQGFVDEAGKFYNRNEAAEHAVECGQQFYCSSPVDSAKRFKSESPDLPFALVSEDLW